MSKGKLSPSDPTPDIGQSPDFFQFLTELARWPMQPGVDFSEFAVVRGPLGGGDFVRLARQAPRPKAQGVTVPAS